MLAATVNWSGLGWTSGKLLVHLLGRTAVVLALIIVVALVVLRWQGYQVRSVQTGSMAPTFAPGDAVIVKSAPMSVRPGEVVMYHSPVQPAVLISHRLRSIDSKTGELKTQGDALITPDPAFSPRLVVGRVMAVVPHAGRCLDWLRHPWGLILAVYLPVGAILVSEVYRLVGRTRPSYRLHY